jgi:hypothetical protein
MARFTSSVEKIFVTCSAPNITGGKIHRWRHCLHCRSGLHYRSLSKESKNNIIFSGFFVEQMCIIEANRVNNVIPIWRTQKSCENIQTSITLSIFKSTGCRSKLY